VRDLLTHTAGLGEVAHAGGVLRPDWGESVPEGEPLPSLADFYGGAIRLDAEPGSRFIYGNHSPAVLGQLVEDVTGESLDRVFRERIFEPLGMTDSDLLRSAAVRARLATGYDVGRDGPKPVAERDMVTAGAASIYSTPRDMARYASALLAGGSNDHGSVLRPETVAMMFAPQHQPDPRLPGMGLGFFRADLHGHRVVEHQGVHPGFHSQLALAPDDGVGVIAFTNGAERPMFWLQAEVAGLLRELVGVPADGVRPGIPPRPEVWDDIRGWYRLAAAPTDIRLRAMLGAGIEVVVRDDGPRLRFLTPIPDLYRGFALHPDEREDPDVFRIDLDEMGTTRVVFSRRPDGSVAAVHLGLMPLTLARQQTVTNPRLWLAATLGVLSVASALALIRRLRAGTQRR
jgi:CubicO group peptidase (beta-lactamase class C family)